MAHIAVIGAGLTGVTTAYVLARRGYRVTVFDRHRYAGMETSYANAGQLSACNAEVWNKLSTVVQGLRWMLRRDAPLLVNPRPSWHKYSWMAAFMRHIPDYRQNTIETVRMAIAARDHLFEMATRENIAFDLERRGILHVYRDKASFEKGVAVDALLGEGGLVRQRVDREDMRSIEPALQGDYYGGFFTPSDSTGDIHKFTRGLAAACAKRGVAFVHDAEVDTIRPSGVGFNVSWHAAQNGRHCVPVDAVVICAGTQSRRFAAMLGDRLNIYPVKGYAITVDLGTPESQAAAPYVSLIDDASKIATSRLGRERFRVAGTAEFNGFNKDVRDDRIKPLVDWTRARFPDVATDRIVTWAGLRPMTPSLLPRVGRGRRPGIFYNTGHGHLGWTLAGATAPLVAEAISREVKA